MAIEWKGIMPAITTKFKKDESLDISLFQKSLQVQVDASVNAIILCGTLGESSVLDNDEKITLLQSAIDVCKNKIPVIMNIAEGSLREAIKQVNNAEKNGAEGLMLLPPMRYKPDFDETIYWFKTIANETSLDILLYNNPVDYKTEITLDMFEALIEIKNIKAVKESTRDVTNVTRMINRFGHRIKILCGVDTLAVEELCLGADGWVAGLVCAFPYETVAIYKLIKAGRIEEAIKIYRWFMPLLELDIHPKLVQYIKLAESRTGPGNEFVRAPRLQLSKEERPRILKIIDDALAKRPELPTNL